MNIVGKQGKHGLYVVALEDFYGHGFAVPVYNAIINTLKPDSLLKLSEDLNLTCSESEYLFTKDGIEVKVEADDLGPAAFILKDNTPENREKVLEWARMIAIALTEQD
ncbi:MAG: hypothetical protein ACO1N9_07750 [Flavobacterium sp.]